MPVLALARFSAMIAAGLLVGIAPHAPANAAPSGVGTLTAAVTDKLVNRGARLPGYAAADAPETRVTVTRAQGRWAFGSAVLVAPRVEGMEPRDWLFLAERRDGAWRVAFDGESAFPALSARAPVVSARERAIFASHGAKPSTSGERSAPDKSSTAGEPGTAANGDFRTGMRLPWAVGQSWTLLGGPHAWDAGSGPWSSLDLAGGDQRVLAARAGVAYTTCTGRILVYHDRGYTTRHYHLINHGWFDGESVSAGAFLGYTGTEVGCGGSARSRHVHFSLLQNGEYVGIARHIIGKWVPMNGSAQYQGYALHGSTRVNVGGALYNYGALGLTQGIVDTNGGGTLNKRSGPGTGYSVVGSVSDGATVAVSCSRNGTTHRGRWGTTSLWNRLTDGTWVSDAYVYTGLSGPVDGWC